MRRLRSLVAAALLWSCFAVGTASVTAAPIRREVPVNLFAASPFPLPVMSVRMTSGPATQVVQVRLLGLGYWLKAADGEFDMTTRQAVMAFQKFTGLEATGSVGVNQSPATRTSSRSTWNDSSPSWFVRE